MELYALGQESPFLSQWGSLEFIFDTVWWAQQQNDTFHLPLRYIKVKT